MNATAFKKVTARGKRYVYIRGTNVALIRGFEGTAEQLDEVLKSEVVSAAIAAQNLSVSATMIGWRMDAAKLLHKITKARAQQKKRTYTLSADTIARMMFDGGDRCELTGLKFDYGLKKNTDWLRRPLAPSLDRISNKGGYDPGNVRLVCTSVNVAINEWGLEHFALVCRNFVGRNG
jgi:hypothetical protein